MRERAIATIFVWIASAYSIERLINSLRYVEYVANPSYVAPDVSGITDPMLFMQLTSMGQPTIAQTVYAPGFWMIAVVLLIGFIALMAMVATHMMWSSARESRREENAAQQAAKTKRIDPQREARVRRLLDSMDDDEIAALEAGEFNSDGEVTMESLLRRQ